MLVNTPLGLQQLIEIEDGGSYFDSSLVVWDERADGTLPLITLGGMKRVGNELVFDEQLIAAHNAVKDAEQAKSIRNSRTEMLKDSDWTQITDATADKAAWAIYRQALRDITEQAGFPWTITWPDTP